MDLPAGMIMSGFERHADAAAASGGWSKRSEKLSARSAPGSFLP